MNEQMIDKYNIRLNDDKDKLVVDGRIGKSTKDKQYVKEHKEEIVDILIQREKAEEDKRLERRRKIEAIEGLVELQNAMSDWNKYNNEFSRYVERDCTGTAPKKPEVTVEELKKRYPKAAAYVKADQWSYSSHYFKASRGQEAKERIINGDNYKDVIADMETAWNKYTEENVD